MSDIIIALLKVAFLAVMWLFILIVANVIRTDMVGRVAVAGSARSGGSTAATAPPRKRSKKKARILAIDTGLQAGQRLQLVERFQVGRSSGCALILDDDYVSNEHAELAQQPNGDWVLSDLGSTNGTFVNGERVVTPTVVTPADSIRIGQTHMRLET